MEVDEDEWFDDPEPDELADPECINCGGTGGWLQTYDGRDVWVWCDCINIVPV